MRPGGTINTKVFQADLNEIQSGQYSTNSLLRLPLLNTFHSAAANPYVYGARPDLQTQSQRNPIVGNVAGGAQITASRIIIPEPANCLTLVWHALDPGGNYECSYPINDSSNVSAMGWQVTERWAFGWMRLNGQGVWFPMSLFKSMDVINAGDQSGIFPFGGYTSILAPMSFVDWVGYWDGVGNTSNGPSGGNAYILAISSINTSVSSNSGTIGQVANYATPSGSGTEASLPNTDTQRNQDILVRSGNGRS